MRDRHHRGEGLGPKAEPNRELSFDGAELRHNELESEAAQRDFSLGRLSLPIEDPQAAPEPGTNSIRPPLPGEGGVPPPERDEKAARGRFNLDPVPPTVVSDAARTAGIDDLAPAAPASVDLKLFAAHEDSVAEETQPRVDRHESQRLPTDDKPSEFPLASL